jgi:hypothetical protein
MTKPVGFSAFLKLLELSLPARRTAMKRLMLPGGFAYWSPMQSLAPSALPKDADLEVLKSQIDSVSSGVRAQYNKNGLQAIYSWAQGKTVTSMPLLPKLVVPFGNSGISVQLKPELSYVEKNKVCCTALWATTKPALSVQTLSVGLFFLSRAYRAKGHNVDEFCIFDTVANKLFREGDILPNAAILLKSRNDEFKAIWAEVNKGTIAPASKSPDDKLPKPPIP